LSEADRHKWNARYRERTARVSEASTLVTSLAEVLPWSGRALDVAGGAGRHAIWLARRGLDVTLVDVSEVALDLARASAKDAGVDIATSAVDLDADPLPGGPWQLILCFHFLERRLFPRYAGLLAPGGLLVVIHPTVKNLERHKSPSARFLLDPGELRRLAGDLVIDRYEEGWLAEGRHEALLVARRSG
jgi:tellurite methyltransferase